MSLTLKEVIQVFNNIEQTIFLNRQFLTDLDAAIGDGDHGINLSKGFKAVSEKLKTAPIKDVSDIFKLSGMAIVSTVGGASGPLYGTALMKAATLCAGRTEISLENFKDILNAAIGGVKLRGGADKGDKTMLDALLPAFEELRKAVEANLDSLNALQNAYMAAEEGVEYTKTIAARKGRASYLGERSIGHQDPGATSSYLILKTVYETVKVMKEK